MHGGSRPLYGVQAMQFENPAGYTPWIARWEIIDVHSDDLRPGHYVIVLADGDLYELAHPTDAYNIATMLEHHTRLELRGLV